MEKKPFEQFLESRHLFNAESEDYGLNHNSQKLHGETNSEAKDKVPFVLFSSCPTDLLELDIKDSNHIQWIKDNSNITIKEYDIRYLKTSKTHFDIDSFTLNDDFNGRIRQYVEFYENGFIEQGFTYPMIYGHRQDDPHGINLGRITIGFWCFLYFLKKYYTKFSFSGTVDLRIIIRNSDILNLTGFKGKTVEDRIWQGFMIPGIVVIMLQKHIIEIF